MKVREKIMYTILRLEYKDNITYLMIVTNNICNTYDFLTYDTRKSIFVDESFTYDSFMTQHKPKKLDMEEMIIRIGDMIRDVGLKKLMYCPITEYRNMKIESIHVPEEYYFMYDESLEI